MVLGVLLRPPPSKVTTLSVTAGTNQSSVCYTNVLNIPFASYVAKTIRVVYTARYGQTRRTIAVSPAVGRQSLPVRRNNVPLSRVLF